MTIEVDDNYPITEWRAAMSLLEAAVKAAEHARVQDVVAHLVSLKDIGVRWEMQPSAIGMLRKRHATFPEPVAAVGSALLFWGPDVDEFMRAYTHTRVLS